VASMPMVRVNARKPNRKIVILAMWPPLDAAVQAKISPQRFQSIAAGRVEVIRIVCRVTVSVQIQVDDKNTDQMHIQCDKRPCQHHASA
jgi:hypothetical protein